MLSIFVNSILYFLSWICAASPQSTKKQLFPEVTTWEVWFLPREGEAAPDPKIVTLKSKLD